MNRSLAVVGIGPRGLYALESLSSELNLSRPKERWSLTLFDDSGFPGSGPNYAPDQSPLNLLNIPCREVPLPGRCASTGYFELPAFPGYLEWQAEFSEVDDQGYDVFPSRASIGQYLQARFRSWLEAWESTQDVNLVMNTAVRIENATQDLVIEDSSGERHGGLSHVLLTIGHQPVEPDKSMVQWRQFADGFRHCLLVEHPYPTDQFMSSKSFTQRRIAVRGMGLSMIDSVKALTEGRGGEFHPVSQDVMKFKYHPSAREPSQILPFSLDGLPMAPKPANKAIDALFTPEDSDLDALKELLSSHDEFVDGESFNGHIIEFIAGMCSRVYLRLSDEKRLTARETHDSLSATIRQWLQNESHSHTGLVSHDIGTDLAMRHFLSMATSHAPISIDYCVGQVWRQCHKTFYRQLAFAGVETGFLVPFIQLDQRMKRYAFGPPVDSVARLLALVDCGIVKFSVAEDPVIRPEDSEWTLIEQGIRTTVDVMVNTVQASPTLTQVTTSIVKSLREDQVLQSVDDSLGAKTQSDGRVPVNKASAGIALSGRLATGSIVEADALMECFGPALEDWATSVVSG